MYESSISHPHNLVCHTRPSLIYILELYFYQQTKKNNGDYIRISVHYVVHNMYNRMHCILKSMYFIAH